MEILFVKKNLCLDLKNLVHDVTLWSHLLGDQAHVGQVLYVTPVVFCI